LLTINLSEKEIKALLVACAELSEKLPFVIKDYYEDFHLGFQSNDDIEDGLFSVEEKIKSIMPSI
jgi:hypothetical protein